MYEIFHENVMEYKMDLRKMRRVVRKHRKYDVREFEEELYYIVKIFSKEIRRKLIRKEIFFNKKFL